jgi:manganese/zinc/iron transport system substrate-binding protein
MVPLVALTMLVSVAEASTRLTVVTTIAQIAEPLRAVVGDRASVESLMGEGVDPHLYRPTRSDMLRLTHADVIFWNGLHLEAQMEEALERLGKIKTVVSIADALAADRLLPWDGAAHDPHIWMDPSLWRAAITRAVKVLEKLDVEGAPIFRANAKAYFKRLEAMETYSSKSLDSIPAGARVLVTAHDAFGYFGRCFNLEVLGIQGISTESEAGLRKIEGMVNILVQRKVPAVFVETSVSDRNVQALIEGADARDHRVLLGGRLFSDAMGPAGTYEGTYIGMIDHNVTTITRALGGQAPERGLNGRLGHAD